MSVINQMLRDLDARQAAPAEAALLDGVRPVAPTAPRQDRLLPPTPVREAAPRGRLGGALVAFAFGALALAAGWWLGGDAPTTRLVDQPAPSSPVATPLPAAAPAQPPPAPEAVPAPATAPAPQAEARPPVTSQATEPAPPTRPAVRAAAMPAASPAPAPTLPPTPASPRPAEPIAKAPAPAPSPAPAAAPSPQAQARQALAEQRPQAALALLRPLAAAGQLDAEGWMLKANAAQRLGEHAEAVAAYEAALQQRPGEALWLAGKAISLAALGRRDEARAAAAQARAGGRLEPALASYLEQLGL